MDILVTTQFDEMCRACMIGSTAQPNIQFQSIFEYIDDFKQEKIQILRLLNDTVHLLPKIEIIDELPKNICSSCLKKLSEFYEFQNCCIKSDLHFRKFTIGAFTDSTDPLQSESQTIVKEEIILNNELNDSEIMKDSVVSKENELRSDAEEFEELITPEVKIINEVSYNTVKDEVIDDATDKSVVEENNIENNEFLDDKIGFSSCKRIGNKRVWCCESCEATFKYPTNLWYHMRHIHSINTSEIINKQYVCKICKHYFMHKANYEKHLNQEHNIGIEQANAMERPIAFNKQSELVTLNLKTEDGISSNESNNNGSPNDKNTNQNEEQTIWICPSCPKTFFNKRQLTEHIKRGPNQCRKSLKEIVERFTCDICKSTFTQQKNLRRHMINIHNIDNRIRKPKKPKNKQPNISSESKQNTIKNETLLIMDNEKQIQIPLPNISDKHMDIESDSSSPENIDNTQEDVKETNEMLTEQQPQEKGSGNNIKSKTWTCKICQSVFVTKRNLQRHTENVHKIGLWDAQAELTTENSKAEAPVYKCDLCIRVFSRIAHFNTHKLQHLDPKPKPLKSCQYCNKTFNRNEHLRDHERKHRNEKAYLCAHCGKTFATSGALSHHSLRHSSEKRYICPHCPSKFATRSDLIKHVKQVHDPKKPFVCDICGAAFKRSTLLRIHGEIHTGHKRFKCEYCDKRFSVGEHMRRHMRTHTGEKPLKCKYCTRSYNSPSDLRKHLRFHLGENIYQCELCPCNFRLDGELRAHFASHKNDDEETIERNKLARLEILEQLKLRLAKENSTS